MYLHLLVVLLICSSCSGGPNRCLRVSFSRIGWSLSRPRPVNNTPLTIQAPRLTPQQISRGNQFAGRLLRSWNMAFRKKRSVRDDANDAKLFEEILNHRSKRQTSIKRKEYRQMTEKEMKRFHQCLQRLKSRGIYDTFVRMHQIGQAPAAHFGIAFLPWHRHFLYLFENQLRRLHGCRKVFIPYWDSALDEPLRRPQDSILWTNQFWGSHTGLVRNGQLCPNWTTDSICQVIAPIIRRENTGLKLDIYSVKKVLMLQNENNYKQFASARYGLDISYFELEHGYVHCFVGTCQLFFPGCRGHMGCIPCSPVDPVFWMHHSYVDCIWDEWARRGFTRNFYPQHIQNLTLVGGSEHLINAPMEPFRGLRNGDGFRKNLYSGYEIRPTRFPCKKDADCKSPMGLLYCPHRTMQGQRGCYDYIPSNRRFCRCKVQKGGRCYFDEECYCGRNKTPVCRGNNRCACK